MLSVVMLNVIMMNVVALPKLGPFPSLDMIFFGRQNVELTKCRRTFCLKLVGFQLDQ
jgi:hypothetical protein